MKTLIAIVMLMGLTANAKNMCICQTDISPTVDGNTSYYATDLVLLLDGKTHRLISGFETRADCYDYMKKALECK